MFTTVITSTLIRLKKSSLLGCDTVLLGMQWLHLQGQALQEDHDPLGTIRQKVQRHNIE
jgi:hypothetical protein